jgi:hypothetical protein
MIIDLREIKTLWINLDRATKNAESIINECNTHGVKNHERFSAICVDPSNPLCQSSHPHMHPYLVGCGLSHIECIEKSLETGPTLILEDDATITPAYNPILEVPDNCDAIYLGVSTGSPNYVSCRYNENYLRIGRMLAAHAVIYISEKYKRTTIEVAKHFVHNLKWPWDISTSTIQEKFLVLTPNLPYYIQSNERDSEHKWQFFTDKAIVDKGFHFNDNI